MASNVSGTIIVLEAIIIIGCLCVSGSIEGVGTTSKLVSHDMPLSQARDPDAALIGAGTLQNITIFT